MTTQAYATSEETLHRLFKHLVVSAKIDFIKIATEGHSDLPELDGTAEWQPSLHYKQLTLQDPSPRDLSVLAACFPDSKLVEFEVAVDIRVRKNVSAGLAQRVREFVMVSIVAMRHDPTAVPDIDGFRAGFISRRPEPFNRRRPTAYHHLVHGHGKKPAQAKAYMKEKDRNAPLASVDRSVRMEANLKEGLARRGLHVIADLFTFKLRDELSPFFTIMRGFRVRANDAHHAERCLKLWKSVGIGAFKPRGAAAKVDVVFLRAKVINDRVGQALMRLERSLNQEGKFVLFRGEEQPGGQALARHSEESG